MSSRGSSSKRSKKNHGFAAPVSDDENPLASQVTAPSSTSFSTRPLTSTKEIPTLVELCISTFSANIQFLFDEKRREATQYWLKTLPEAIVPRLFAVLSGTHPTLLSHGLMIAYFLRGDPMILSGSIPGVSALTIQALAKTDTPLKECHLRDLNKISDFASLFSKLPMCEILVLKGSTKVGKKSIDAIANTCKRLRVLNLNFTSAPPASIAFLTGECIELEILKLAGISLINDTSFSDILHISNDGMPLRRLRRLKLRHTSITDQSLKWIGSICIHLTHLDVSFTPIKQPLSLCDSNAFIPELEKLSLTSTPLTSTFLLKVKTNVLLDSPLKFLRTLHIGALGASPSSRIRSTPDSLTLTDEVLDSLTDALYECKLLENISLVGNSKLGLRSKRNSSLSRFIRKVGRRCKVLNLAAISRLTSSDLSGLPPVKLFTDEIGDDPAVYEASPLQILNINNTAVDNEAAEYIATCPKLQILNVAGTKLDYACDQLDMLNLTSCRNIKVADRRRFFEPTKPTILYSPGKPAPIDNYSFCMRKLSDLRCSWANQNRNEMTCDISPTVLSQLVDIYYRVLALPSLAPSPRVNQTFSELVSLCLQIKIPSNHLTYHLDEVCKKDNNKFNILLLITRAMEAEGCMERYWAGILATADNLQTAMQLFWYWDNYASLTKYELESLKAAGCSTFRRVAFVGSGPLPLTALLIAQEVKSHVVLYDRDAEANELAGAWIGKLPLGKEQFSFRDADVWDVAPDEFTQYDIIWIAASVGTDGKEKSGVVEHVRKRMRPGAFLAIRSVEMGCSLLYPEIQHSELGDVDIVRHDIPPQGVVNSVIVLRA